MFSDLVVIIVAALGAAGLAGAVFFVFGRRIERRAADAAGQSGRQQAERLLSDARREADAGRAAAIIEGKEEILRLRETFEQEVQGRRQETERAERRIEEREGQMERRLQLVEDRERGQADREAATTAHLEAIETREREVARLEVERRQKLEALAGMSAEEAVRGLRQELEDQARSDAAAMLRDVKEEAKRTAEREARKIVATAVQRVASDTTASFSVSSVALPNDEMKGRIIGREGRNIRAFELATGVDVIIDDTPDTVVVSCFDPIRREIARRSMETLISDGRIHPGRIEEVISASREQLEKELVEVGEQTVYDLGLTGIHAELVKLVGRMKYRTSYGQNILEHSKEVAWLAGMMAAELKLDVTLAKRGALLHDVGKVLTHTHEGTHVELGVEMATKYGEQPIVINAIAAHHDDVPHASTISVIVQAADAISGSRPGARREAFETYVKRLTNLEAIASSYDGVEKTFAIQAGREVRIVVTPDRVDDGKAQELADTIARRIEGELQYPGQIRVVVIRETRAVDVAR